MKPFLLNLLFCTLMLPASAQLLNPEQSASTAPVSLVKLAAENTQRLLTSLRDGDRAVFVENATTEFQEAMTEQAFAQARAQLLPILNVESQLDYLGQLNKGTDTIYLYRLRPEKGGIDSLVTLAMRGGTVSGFFVN